MKSAPENKRNKMIDYEKLPEVYAAAADTPHQQPGAVRVRRLEPGELAALVKMSEPRYYRQDSNGQVFEAGYLRV
jgi:hypothetical protein